MTGGAPDHDIDLTAEHPAFGRLARVAKALFGAPFADVVLVRDGLVWRHSVGVERADDPAPLVSIVMQSLDVIWIGNAAQHPGLAEHPLVAGDPHLRFFAGAPIITADGAAIGGLTVIDTQPRGYDHRLAARLMDLAKVVGAACDQARERQELDRARRRLNVALQIADVHVWEMDYARRTLETAGAEDTFFERSVTFDDLFESPAALVHPDDRERILVAAGPTLDGLEQPLEYRINRADGREVWASSVLSIERDAEGRPARVIGAMRNITRRKQAETAEPAKSEADRDAGRPKAPIHALSAKALIEYAKAAFTSVTDGRLTKPVAASAAPEALSEVLTDEEDRALLGARAAVTSVHG